MKKFVFTVLIQPFHCAIYMCLISTALDILVKNAGAGADEETLAAAIIAILCIKFTKDAEKLSFPHPVFIRAYWELIHTLSAYRIRRISAHCHRGTLLFLLR